MLHHHKNRVTSLTLHNTNGFKACVRTCVRKALSCTRLGKRLRNSSCKGTGEWRSQHTSPLSACKFEGVAFLASSLPTSTKPSPHSDEGGAPGAHTPQPLQALSFCHLSLCQSHKDEKCGHPCRWTTPQPSLPACSFTRPPAPGKTLSRPFFRALTSSPPFPLVLKERVSSVSL